MKNILVLLAHHDDEIFMFEKLKRHHDQGDHITLFFLSYNPTFGEENNIRVNESNKTLEYFKNTNFELHNLGLENKYIDGELYKSTEKIFEAVNQRLTDKKVNIIYTHAWEGGHHDHDAVHLIAKAYSLKHEISKIYEFPYYNSYNAPKGLFRVMTLPPSSSKSILLNFSIIDGIKSYLLIFNYPSQRKTFFGLSPGMIVNLLFLRRIKYRSIEGMDYSKKPHNGSLLYETRFHLTFQNFHSNTKQFIAKYFTKETIL